MVAWPRVWLKLKAKTSQKFWRDSETAEVIPVHIEEWLQAAGTHWYYTYILLVLYLYTIVIIRRNIQIQ